MPKSAQYIIRWSVEKATYLSTDGTSHLLTEGEDWQYWLQTHRSFAFHGRNGRINLLKEKRSRGDNDYWYAYQRHAEKMVKHYAGRSAQLDMERLEEITLLLTKKDGVSSNISSEILPPAVHSIQFEPLLMPKLQLPRLQKSLLKREQLLNVLDKSLEHTFTLIAGPAGYGKTTAVAQWISEQTTRPDAPQIA